MTLVRTATVLMIVVGVLRGAPAGAQTPDVRRLTVDDAVRLALEFNLGVRVARIDPQIQDLAVAEAQAAWSPTLSTSVQGASANSPSNSFLSGAQGTKTSDGRIVSTIGVEQALPWGGRYSVGWDGTRSTTTNLFSNFSPQVRSSLSLTYQQPLLRGFRIDAPREQLLLAGKDREVADMTLASTLVTTARAVRYAYWDLAYSRDSLEVQRQSLELARESLRNTRARIEIGTTPPIDEIEAEAEVALREEAVILAEAQIATTEDALRVLIYDPSEPTFWTRRIETTPLPPAAPPSIDVEAATNGALARRTDLRQLRNRLEAADISLRLSRDRTLPDVTASVDYGLTGLGGTQFVRGPGFPGPIVGQTERGFGSVLSDLLQADFPSWTASLTVSYPIGTTPQAANVARSRLRYTQQQTELQNAVLQVTAQVRDAARLVQTNQKRLETTAVSRQAAERRLDAEGRKLTAGTSTSFLVFQAQRDLAQVRNNELRAALDLQRSLVDLETVQEAPLR